MMINEPSWVFWGLTETGCTQNCAPVKYNLRKEMWLHWDLQLPQACNSAQLNVVWVSVGILIGQCPECDVGFVLMLNSQCLSASAFKSSLTVKLSFYCLLFIFLRSSRPQLFHSWQKYTYIWTIKFFGPRVKSIDSISNRGLSPHDVTHLIYFEVPFWSLESTIMAEAIRPMQARTWL